MVRRAWRLRRARRAGGGRRRRLRSHRPSGHSDPLGAGRRWAQMARGPSSVGDGGVSTLTGARQPVLTRRQVRAVPPGGGDSPGRQGRAGDLSCGAGQDRFCAKTAALLVALAFSLAMLTAVVNCLGLGTCPSGRCLVLSVERSLGAQTNVRIMLSHGYCSSQNSQRRQSSKQRRRPNDL